MKRSKYFVFNFFIRVLDNSTYHDGLDQFIKHFRHDSHPMGMLSTLIAAMSTFYPEANPAYVGANIYKSKQERNKHIYRVLGSATSIAAACFRHRNGLPLNQPDSNLGFIENMLYMMDKHIADNNFIPHPKIAKILEILFILYADHELNNSTAAMRHMASS